MSVSPRRASALAEAMVQGLRTHSGLRDDAVADAFRSVPRHVFVPGTPLDEVYRIDAVIPTHFGADGLSTSSSSAPNIMATMLEQLDVRSGMRVLEIGAGTGYNAGLVAYLTGADGAVVSIDLDPTIVAEARAHLARAGIANARVDCADGWLGAPADAPFDRVIATVGVWEIAPAWFDQLRPGGVIVLPLWLRAGAQMCVAFVREEYGFRSVSLCACGFMRLRGPNAGPDAQVVVPGWRGRIDGPTARDWMVGLEHATAPRLETLRALLRTAPTVMPVPLPPPGWTARVALTEPDAIEFLSRMGPRRHAMGIFDPERPSLAVFEAGRIVAFGDPAGAHRLRSALAAMQPLYVEELEIFAVRHPAGAVPDAWVLARPHFDVVVKERRATEP
jgi:protein-L-isoaspartate(D-aspartate) O-methyltransferase